MSNERYEVAKAGGWSLASTERIRPLVVYVKANSGIHYFIPSALGAVNEGDFKVTDLLIGCSPQGGKNPEFNRVWHKVRNEYNSLEAIINELRLRHTSLGQELGYYEFPVLLDKLEEIIDSSLRADSEKEKEKYRQLIPSRGEWLNGHMWAELLGFRFVDPAELMRFKKDDQFDERSYAQIRSRLRGKGRVVIPGFYALGADGQVRTFPRDGSDVSAAHIAAGINASMYHNLTSADGVLSADPRVVDNPKLIGTMTFEEYRELGNAGVKVLHKDTITPVAKAGIPIHVGHSLKQPESHGTMVVSSRPNVDGQQDVIGVAGKQGLVSLNIHKYGMNDEKGVEGRILNIIRQAGVSIDHVPSENDRLSVIFTEDQLGEKKDETIDKIQRRIRPQSIQLQRDIGFISVVGQGIKNNRAEVSRRLLASLEDEAIKYHGATIALSGMSIILFVDSSRVNDAIRAAYKEFIR